MIHTFEHRLGDVHVPTQALDGSERSQCRPTNQIPMITYQQMLVDDVTGDVARRVAVTRALENCRKPTFCLQSPFKSTFSYWATIMQPSRLRQERSIEASAYETDSSPYQPRTGNCQIHPRRAWRQLLKISSWSIGLLAIGLYCITVLRRVLHTQKRLDSGWGGSRHESLAV
ncbi:hypothetical protein EDB19DRAFT_1827920 [Suillus lakei]|nr:hypothetical protein EDB19DRAFT_1827920 [Suillus lakei]